MVDDDPHPRAVDRGELESRLAADVRAVTAGSDRIGRIFANMHHISNNDLDALLHVIVAETAGAPLTAGDMRQRLGVSAPAVTYVIDRMIASGHIRRETDPLDRRKVILRYSDHGLQVARQFFGPLGGHMHDSMADLPDEDLDRRSPGTRRGVDRNARLPRSTRRLY